MFRTRKLFAGLGLVCSVSMAQVSIADFESGVPPGWTVDSSAWTVGGATGTSPNVTPPQGSFFARSGAPNVGSGPLAEKLTGTLTSVALTVSYDTLQWLANGWSGQFGNGLNRFEILDSTLSVKATIFAPLTDNWTTQTVNLLGSGLSAGETFYFRAVDGNSADSYAWLAVDDIKLVGNPVPAPEPPTIALLIGGGMIVSWVLRRRRTHGKALARESWPEPAR